MKRRKSTKPIWKSELIEGIGNQNTRRNYQSVLDSLEEYFRPFKGSETALQLIRFVRSEQGKGISPQTAKQRLSVLNNIVEFAKKSSVRGDNPVERSWVPKVKVDTKPKCPTKTELNNLDQVLNAQSGFLGARDNCMIGLMRFEALRVHEVSGLNHEDIKYHRDGIELKINGKGGYQTEMWLYPQSCKLINHYKKYIPADERQGPFFIPAYQLGKRLDSRSIRKRCNQLFKQAGWRKGLSCHSLRHQTAVTLLENGVPLTEVSRKLRHRFLSSTFSYYSDVPSLRNPKKINTAYK
ncbi:tyrosine-type recombinase/integrase [Pseudobdellovibrio exovorus]|uniref:Tyr recombinase domain-containing protein n=1 Tax=Pseudobdellovibrio exovorus JSS TaxID=1184267 RepID=M4VA91_9BACT|nr:tyrosine-type recombinase/integrase [Pseudobdellovibrio exovorus]AGH95385.1 hypothetical protein A11Q_1169 [Pseudobdellovibrio exovorus JSS]